jgi:hypothetical protein
MRQGDPFAYSFNLMTVPSADPSLVAVPLPSDEELTRVIGKSYDSDKTLNVEMIVLRVAAKYHVLYEWQAQSTLASNVGLSPEEIQAAASDVAIEGIDADYRLAWKATDEICIEGTLRDETLRQSRVMARL